jgi:hypothetical protein
MAQNHWAVPLQLWSYEHMYLSLAEFHATLKMSEEKEQGMYAKFCIKLGKNSAETFEMLKTVFGDECLSHAQTFEWLKRFKESQTSVTDDQQSG